MSCQWRRRPRARLLRNLNLPAKSLLQLPIRQGVSLRESSFSSPLLAVLLVFALYVRVYLFKCKRTRSGPVSSIFCSLFQPLAVLEFQSKILRGESSSWKCGNQWSLQRILLLRTVRFIYFSIKIWLDSTMNQRLDLNLFLRLLISSRSLCFICIQDAPYLGFIRIVTWSIALWRSDEQDIGAVVIVWLSVGSLLKGKE
jgi:hypothetical protein